jgi:hypothetical protein
MPPSLPKVKTNEKGARPLDVMHEGAWPLFRFVEGACVAFLQGWVPAELNLDS